MARHTLPRAGVAWSVVLVALELSAGELVPGLDKVEGIERLKAPPAARELLKKNGFVVVPRFYHQIFSPYIQEGLPPFVTTDSLHRTFHVIFEKQLQAVETALSADVAAMAKGMADEFNALRQAGDLTQEGEEAASLAEAFFTVAAKLLGEATRGGTDAERVAAAEVKLVQAAEGIARSPLFGYDMDYSQCKPRGFYTQTPALRRHFQAMSWLGNAAFRLCSDRETRAAMLIAQRFGSRPAFRERWQKIDRIYTQLIGPADDLTPEDYAGLIDSMQKRRIVSGAFEWFKRHAAALRDPTISSRVLSPDAMPRWRELSKGMCFFGKRWAPDSEVFTALCHPHVRGRYFPSGLDVMAVMGSARARELQEKAGEAERKGYQEGLRTSQAAFGKLMGQERPSHYVESLKLARTLLAPPGDDALPFMQTAAYADKNLMTALSLWASLRHAWVLHTKQSMTTLGFDRRVRPSGWVEPNFPFYDQLHRLIRRTLDVLGPIEGVDRERLEALDELVVSVAAAGRKQARGEPLTADEHGVLARYGIGIARLAYFEGQTYALDLGPWMSLVADVHTEAVSAQCLEVATGGAMPMFVVIPYQGKQHLMVGGVYSYHEFWHPIADRLTDEKWRGMVGSGKVPPMPAWRHSFVAGFDAAALIDRIRKGEWVEDILYINDPAIEEFLAKATAPGGELDGKENLAWAVRTYGLKAPDQALPTLLRWFAEPLGPAKMEFRRPDGKLETEEYREGGPRAAGAAEALAELPRPEHLPVLEKVALGDDEDRVDVALDIIEGMGDKAAERSLARLLAQAGPDTQWDILYRLAERGSRDVTPAVLEAYPAADDWVREEIMEALERLWGQPWDEEETPEVPRWPEEMTEAALAALRPKIEAVVLDALRHPLRGYFQYAAPAAASLRIAEAVPLLEAACAAGEMHSARQALCDLGGEEAVRALLRLTYVDEGEGWDWEERGDTLGVLAELKHAVAAPRMFELLGSKDDRILDHKSVRDLAAEVLLAIYPDGPAWPAKAAEAERRKAIAAWQAYLQRRGVPTRYELSPEEARRVSGWLLARAEHHARPADPARAIGRIVRARQLAGEGVADHLHDDLIRLTRAEVRQLAELVEQASAENGGAYPDPKAPLPQVVGDQYHFDPLRVTETGYLDAWGRPYRYVLPAPGGKAPFAIYSVGPNGKDEGGEGDDIAS